MSDEKALALRLAEVLEKRRLTRWVHSTGETPRASGYVVDQECTQAAAELRRLYAEIERLTAAWHCQHVRKVEERAEAKLWFEHAQKLHAVNAELLEALWGMVTSFHAVEWMEPHMRESADKARAAIDKAEGK